MYKDCGLSRHVCCLLIAADSSMCDMAGRRAVGPLQSRPSSFHLAPIWLLLPRDSPCSSMTSGRREGEEASLLAVANPGLLGPNRTTCGLHSPPPGPAPANPAPQNFPALLPHLCPRLAQTNHHIWFQGFRKLVCTCLTSFAPCIA